MLQKYRNTEKLQTKVATCLIRMCCVFLLLQAKYALWAFPYAERQHVVKECPPEHWKMMYSQKRSSKLFIKCSAFLEVLVKLQICKDFQQWHFLAHSHQQSANTSEIADDALVRDFLTFWITVTGKAACFSAVIRWQSCRDFFLLKNAVNPCFRLLRKTAGHTGSKRTDNFTEGKPEDS